MFGDESAELSDDDDLQQRVRKMMAARPGAILKVKQQKDWVKVKVKMLPVRMRMLHSLMSWVTVHLTVNQMLMRMQTRMEGLLGADRNQDLQGSGSATGSGTKMISQMTQDHRTGRGRQGMLQQVETARARLGWLAKLQ